MAKGWTKKGNVKASTRKRTATFKEGGRGKFPIFDRRSAMSAIKLRGHAPASKRAAILRRAARYAPEAARRAREADQGKRKNRRKK